MHGIIDDEAANQHYIAEELPRVYVLPATVRFRSFAEASTEEALRDACHETDFHVHHPRRFAQDAAVSEDDGNSEAVPSGGVQQVMPHTIHDTFAIAARQMTTFQWLTRQQRSADDISARFALDRKLGAPPSMAAVNKALYLLGRDGHCDAALDLVEDVVMSDNASVSLSTLLEAINALSRQPVRATRLAFALQDYVAPAGPLPGQLWERLSADLAQVAAQQTEPLSDNFLDAFERTLLRLRASSARLSETLIVAYGRAMLSSHRPLASAVKLVQEELLSGRNHGDEAVTSLQVSALLSDLLFALCTHNLSMPSTTTMASSATTVSTSHLLVFIGDVVKYVFASKIRLATRTFDAILAFCDTEQAYFRLCILFCAMCALSVPSLRSFLRVVEVVNDMSDEITPRLGTMLGSAPHTFYAWCLQRFSSALLSHPTNVDHDAALLTLGAALGRTFANALAASQRSVALSDFVSCFSALFENTPHTRYAASLASSFLTHCRLIQGCTPLHHELQALEPINAEAIESMLAYSAHTDDARQVARQVMPANSLIMNLLSAPQPMVASSATVRYRAVDAALQHVLPVAQTHCNIIDGSVLSTLAAAKSSEAAFVRMMQKYAHGDGAIVIAPMDVLCDSGQTSQQGRQMVRTWCASYATWFAVLPLSLTMQLQGGNVCAVCCDLFQQIRRIGHRRVAFVTNDNDAVRLAKERGVQPVIVLDDLLVRLGRQGVTT